MKRTIVIIGAAGAVGKNLTERLSKQDCEIYAAVRNTEQATKLDELDRANILTVDSSNWQSIESLFQNIAKRSETIDGIAVCVGSILLKPAHLTSPEEFENVLNQNLRPCFATLRYASKSMMKNGGSVVFVSSAVAKHGYPNHEAIAAAKAGIEGLARSAAASYAPKGIRVNCVAPGLIDSKMSQGIVGNPQLRKASANMHALGRIGSPSEIASAIAWLLDPEQSWVTGQVIGVDGGLGSLHSKKI